MGLTAPADFQRSGSAVFNGPIVLNDQSTIAMASVTGGMTISIDFADENNVTALAGNFFDLAGTRVSGMLSMSGAEFSEGTLGGGWVGDMTGTLRNVGPSESNDDYAYNVSLGTIYYGDGVQGLLVIAGGTAQEEGSTLERSLTGAATLMRE